MGFTRMPRLLAAGIFFLCLAQLSCDAPPTQPYRLPSDPISELFYKLPLDANLTLAPEIKHYSDLKGPLQETKVTNASQLFPITVAGVIRPRNLEDLKAAVTLANQKNLQISLSGSRHSMGGQIARDGALHLDMTDYAEIEYFPENQLIKVESGATWKQIQRAIGPHQRAIGVMQDSNIFTVGGSLSLNVHGKDPRFGTLISQVVSFDLLNAQGELLTCSREQNSELFRAAIGGMGLFGIITEVTLKTEPNPTYRYHVENLAATKMVERMEQQSQRPEVELIEAQMSIDNENMLQEAQVYYFERQADLPALEDDVSGEQSIWLRKVIYQFSRQSDFGRSFRWWLQKEIGPSLDAPHITRNTAMAAPYRLLLLDTTDPKTDILQEVFVPIQKVPDFLKAYRALLRKHQIALQNVTVRKQLQDTEAMISYASSDMYAFVSYYQIFKDKRGNVQMQAFTRDLMDWLNQNQGKFYLAYWPYYTQKQIKTMYPKIADLIALKKQMDPDLRFSNQWYQRMASP